MAPAAAWVPTVLGAAALLYSWSIAYRYFVLPACFDFWLWVDDFQKFHAGTYSFHDLIKPHYGQHRIATTRLLLLVDSLWFTMSGRFVVLCNGAALLLLGLMLWRMATCDVARAGAFYLPLAVWAGFAAATCQFENLIVPFDVQYALTDCCAVGAAWLFATACAADLSPRGGSARAIGGVFCLLAALFSMSSGLLLLPALVLLLWLRRAPWRVGLIFALGAVLALSIEVPRQIASATQPLLPQMQALMPTGAELVARQVLFSADFLGSLMAAVPRAAPWVGVAGYAVLLSLTVAPGWRRLRGGPTLATADAALLAVAWFSASCGPAASLTPRILFGADIALVPRYAAVSLLFWAACAALTLRRLDAAGVRGPAARALVLAATALVLWLVNLPIYAERAAEFQRGIGKEASLLMNNIGVEGPKTVVLFEGIPKIRAAAGFLHAARLNMFAPDYGPPADLMEILASAPPGSLPSCRGDIERAEAIDDGAVVLAGWLADPAGHHTAPWVVLRTSGGQSVGAARAWQERPDVAASPGMKPPAFGFWTGFRDAQSGPRNLRIAALFPGRSPALCELNVPVAISGVQVQPAAQVSVARLDAGVLAGAAGFSSGLGSAPKPAPDLAGIVPFASSRGTAAQLTSVSFSIAVSLPADAALVLPFWTPPDASGKSVTFVMEDGTRFSVALGPWWSWPAWRVAALPASLCNLHGGARRVEVTDAGPGALTVATPVLATLHPGWTRLF